MRIVGLGHGLFAISAASLAILIFIFHDFAPMWPSIPAGSPWREAWVYGSALLLLAASVGLCFSRTALPSALTIGAYQAVWAVTSVPPIVSKPLSVGAWYGLCEALTSLAGTSILYAALRWRSRGSQMPIASERAVRAAQILFGLTCIFYGSSHFTYADYTASMVPTWLPSRLGFAYFTGISYIAAGIGIVLGILARLAATLVAIMMSLFGLLVWMPSFFAHPKPSWATPLQNEWSELEVNLFLAAAAWIVADSLRSHLWGFAPRSRDP
jgi:uncharacterized membrane protein YphA (DoxX/SURF4 family)